MRWPVDFEATVAKNVRRLREGRGLSQQQLGNDLIPHGVGMHQTTVAKLEAGSKPLRLNEVGAIAAYFKVSIESLWQESGEGISLAQFDDLLRDTADAEEALATAEAEYVRAGEQARDAEETANSAIEARRRAQAQGAVAAARLAELEQRRDSAKAALEGLVHVQH